MREVQRVYDQSFREEVLRLIGKGRSVIEVADSLGIGRTTVARWYNREMIKKGKRLKRSSPGSTTESEAETPEEKIERLERENEKLRKENASLQMDRAILKKAAAFFAKESE